MSTVEIAAKDVKALRERTGAGMMDCKKALDRGRGRHREGDRDPARQAGQEDPGPRRARGHRGDGPVLRPRRARRSGVLIEVDCNTDFVAKNEDFTGFAREVAMQIAATPDGQVRQPRGRARGRSARPRRGSTSRRQPTSPRTCARKSSRASSTRGCQTIVLLEQEMHNPKFEGKTVQQLRDELTATTGENVVIRRFVRFAIGQ